MRTLLVSQNPLDQVSSRLRGSVRVLVDSQGPATASAADAEEVFLQIKPEMVIVLLSPDAEVGLALVRKLRQRFSGYLLAVGQASESKLILRALHGGADHYLDEAELDSGLEAVLARVASKNEGAAPAGRIVALLSASGGCGASTLAANIATAMAKDTGRCALIDLNPGRGDLASLLDLKPAFNLADLCLNAARLDRAMFEKVLTRHASGVHLLGSPQMFGDARVVTAQGVNQALSLARKLFTHVVVDLEDCFHEEQVATLRQASTILLVARLDFTSLRNARRILEHLEEIEVRRNRARLVINRHGQPNELPVAEAEEALGEKLNHFVPDDPKIVNMANNAGIPVVIKNPSAKVSQSIVKLAGLVFERRRSDEAPLPKVSAG